MVESETFLSKKDVALLTSIVGHTIMKAVGNNVDWANPNRHGDAVLLTLDDGRVIEIWTSEWMGIEILEKEKNGIQK